MKIKKINLSDQQIQGEEAGPKVMVRVAAVMELDGAFQKHGCVFWGGWGTGFGGRGRWVDLINFLA